MSKKQQNDIYDLTLEQVQALDQNVSQGKARQFYENAQITRATVYQNKVSGRVGNFFEQYDVQLTFHGREIASSCTCEESRKICIHAVALLYAWLNDGKEFLDVERVLGEIKKMKKDRLVEIVTNIIQNNPSLVEMFLSRHIPDWDEIDTDPFRP